MLSGEKRRKAFKKKKKEVFGWFNADKEKMWFEKGSFHLSHEFHDGIGLNNEK